MAASARPFTVNETHGILLLPEHRGMATSDRLGWKSLYASMQREAPYGAAAVGLGAARFARWFKRSTGNPPHQCPMRCRVERARRLLVKTDSAIAQIAASCAFAHQEHLTRVFRCLSGDTPARFRHRACG
jgi:methylphosphotriester-DNA--protein-cysteine methyltransferase